MSTQEDRERWKREQEERQEWRREFLERWWKNRPLWACPDVNEVDDYLAKWANEGDE